MKANYKLIDADSLMAEMTIKMTVKQWKDLSKTIGDQYPGWQFAGLIRDLVNDADKHFHGEHESIR